MPTEEDNTVKNPILGYPPQPPLAPHSARGVENRKYSNASMRNTSQSPIEISRARSESQYSLRSQQTNIPVAAKPYNQISFGENNLLKEIEKLDNDSLSTKYVSRPRAASVANEIAGHRNRKGTVESTETVGKVFSLSGRTNLQNLFDFLDLVVPRLQQRINVYFGFFFLLLLFIISGYFTYPGSSMGMFFCIMLIDTATAIIDHAIFVYFIDRIFVNHYKIAYLLHGFNGPLGLILCILISGASLRGFQATKSLPDWNHLIVACVFVVVCLCLKNWFTRKYYTALLEKRFLNKLFKLETWNILLSELATMKPPKDIRSLEAPITKLDPSQRISTKIRSMLGGMNVADAKRVVDPIVNAAVPALTSLQQTVINAFADLVDATSKYSDEYEEDVDLTLLLKAQQSHNEKADDDEEDIEILEKGRIRLKEESLKEKEKLTLKSQIRKRKTFWELAARMSSSYGTLKIYTYNGPVIIQRKFQAKQFGKSLYKHLSRGGKLVVTTEMLKEIFDEKAESYKADKGVGRLGNSAPVGISGRYDGKYNYQAVQMTTSDLEKDTATLLYESAIELFDPFHVGTITEEQCMAALCLVYKEARFAATSLNEYGELHESLRTVIDIVFWLIMLVVLQAFLQLNLFSYILPFITLALTVSFALTQALGNLFLAIMFVFFMVPYDIGNKVYIGPENNRVVGFVKSVSLLYTTINTTKNEVMKIPNHTLFSEKICNLQESGGAVIEIALNFNLVDTENRSQQDKIDAFLDNTKQYCVVENRMKWQSCFICASTISSTDNMITYMIWVTHRDNWQDISKVFNDRTALIKYIKAMQEEYGLEYMKIRQFVELVHEGEAENYDDMSRSALNISLHRPKVEVEGDLINISPEMKKTE